MLQRYLLISLRTASLVDAPDMIQNKTVIFQFQRSKKEKKTCLETTDNAPNNSTYGSIKYTNNHACDKFIYRRVYTQWREERQKSSSKNLKMRPKIPLGNAYPHGESTFNKR